MSSAFGFSDDLNGYDFNQEQAASDFTPLPAGKYGATISVAEIVPLKSGKGQALKVEYNIDDTEGRKVWDYLCFIHTGSDQAQAIARKSINAIAAAVGMASTPSQPSDLIGKKLCLELKVEPAQNGYAASNKAARYYPYSELTQSTGSASPASASTKDLNDDMPF